MTSPRANRSATLKHHATTALWLPFALFLYVFMGGRSPVAAFDYGRPITPRIRDTIRWGWR